MVTATPLEFCLPLEKVTGGDGRLMPGPICYIFHSGFCGSTLLARYLDRANVCLSYKEPMALTEFSRCSRSLRADAREKLLGRVVASLSKTFDDFEVPLIKLTPGDSLIISELLEIYSSPRPRGLFLFSDLKTFLCSVLPFASRRQWVRGNLENASGFAGAAGILEDVDVAGLRDAEAAALLWLWQMTNYLDVLENAEADQVGALDCQSLFVQPEIALGAVSEFFGLGLSSDRIQEVVASKISDRYSKRVPAGPLGNLLRRVGVLLGSAKRFDPSKRAMELVLNEARVADELRHGIAWAETAVSRAAIPYPIPKTVLSSGKLS
jgi:hypothetical protein